mmetsp:Transcript_10722/g.31879  ORF Transcript_10722/g.31879 Transcript_10722/m.31879 type:complete len:275 (+) Transcript_10722:347-1171(+)
MTACEPGTRAVASGSLQPRRWPRRRWARRCCTPSSRPCAAATWRRSASPPTPPSWCAHTRGRAPCAGSRPPCRLTCVSRSGSRARWWRWCCDSSAWRCPGTWTTPVRATWGRATRRRCSTQSRPLARLQPSSPWRRFRGRRATCSLSRRGRWRRRRRRRRAASPPWPRPGSGVPRTSPPSALSTRPPPRAHRPRTPPASSRAGCARRKCPGKVRMTTGWRRCWAAWPRAAAPPWRCLWRRPCCASAARGAGRRWRLSTHRSASGTRAVRCRRRH